MVQNSLKCAIVVTPTPWCLHLSLQSTWCYTATPSHTSWVSTYSNCSQHILEILFEAKIKVSEIVSERYPTELSSRNLTELNSSQVSSLYSVSVNQNILSDRHSTNLQNLDGFMPTILQLFSTNICQIMIFPWFASK